MIITLYIKQYCILGITLNHEMNESTTQVRLESIMLNKISQTDKAMKSNDAFSLVVKL